VQKFVSTLHTNGQHFVPIVDPGIMNVAGYPPFDRGLQQDVYIKDGFTNNYYLGQVWPGPTAFPDFLHPNAQAYWTNELKLFHDVVPVDGIWIDMNEVSNFCNVDGKGQVCVNTASQGCPAKGASQTDCCLECQTIDATNRLDFPPYPIHNKQGAGLISTKTAAVSSYQYGNLSVYDTHNLYGISEQIVTNKALTDIRGKRPFLLSRSSFLSTGKHSAKWTGDNKSTWLDLASSIISVLDFNLFGVPMIGADICGFLGDTTEELCARWIELGAFYPFSRNHNALGQAPQELYLWPSVTAAAKNALGMRYQLLPFFYTLFHQASKQGSAVARALWFNFPTDAKTQAINKQFMLGHAILLSPVLDQGATSVDAYFPQGLWYDFALRKLAVDASEGGVSVSLDTPLEATNVHVKGGSILPLQQAAMTTTEGRKSPFTLLVALCPESQAQGELFWDDGEQVDIDAAFLSASYAASYASSSSSGSVVGTITHDSYLDAAKLNIESVVVMGNSKQTPLVAPTQVVLNGVALDVAKVVHYDSGANVITFSQLPSNLVIASSFTLEWK